MKFFSVPALVLGLFACAAHSQSTTPAAGGAAPASDLWRVYGSPATLHFHYSEEHRRVYAIGLERQRADGYLLGASWFRNSFGQPSAYLYAGRRFDKLVDDMPLFAQLTGGLLYGYKPPFEDKVPFNHNGYSPGAVFSVGWQFMPAYSAQLNFLGNSALMLQLSAEFR